MTISERQKILDKLVKLQAAAEGEARIGNEEAAQAFAATINRMLLEYEIRPQDLDAERSRDNDPIVEIEVNWRAHMRPGDNPRKFEPGHARIAWQEVLAGVVADANLCKFLIQSNSDRIWFVGTEAHATVAEYLFATLVFAAYDMAKVETAKHTRKCKQLGEPWRIPGFRDSYLSGFISRMHERLKKEQNDVVAGSSTALVRLDQARAKVQTYMNDKFANRGGKLKGLTVMGRNPEGLAAGRAAADRLQLMKGVKSGPTSKGQLR